jgi:deoxyribodipyrimidine photolyase-related protein
MTDATIIYPHQLFNDHPALAPGRPVFLVEEPLLMREFPIHRQKLLLHRLSIQAYQRKLTTLGYTTSLIPLTETSTTEDTFTTLVHQGYTTFHIVDTTDAWLEKRITHILSTLSGTRVSYESPLFILPKAEAVERYQKAKRHMARFYQDVRKQTGILMNEDNTPLGGQWNFDAENRKKIPDSLPPPEDPVPYQNEDTKKAVTWLETIPGEHYGTNDVWLPYTHEAAMAWLDEFLTTRFSSFGPYEDALTTTHHRLFHSILSPLLNIGLLIPQQIINATLAYTKEHQPPLASVEGFLRQIIGWREFIRAAYESDGTTMRTRNFWGHTRPLPPGLWTGETGLVPLDICIKSALTSGYNHHIERLMVLGNYLLLTKTNPDEVYRWFMGMYVDAYDWVMVPNVYGMSQFADGGLFATKPYLSGSNYLRKMSNYPKGTWETVWDALYWNFIHEHKAFFLNNHRLSMMPRLLEKMDVAKRTAHLARAAKYLASLQAE